MGVEKSLEPLSQKKSGEFPLKHVAGNLTLKQYPTLS
jgi:hypothetical protein